MSLIQQLVDDELILKKEEIDQTGKTRPHGKIVMPFIPNIIPKYIYNYPEITDAIIRTRELIELWRQSNNSNSKNKYEIEVRFGKLTARDTFEAGVSQAFALKVVCLLQSFPGWKMVSDWTETHDFFYSISGQTTASTSAPLSTSTSITTLVEISKSTLPQQQSQQQQQQLQQQQQSQQQQQQIRTTTFFEIDTRENKRRLKTEHIRKQVLQKIDCRYSTNQHLLRCLSPGDCYDLRVTLNTEEPIDSKGLPTIVNPTYVRIKSRKSFYYVSENLPTSKPIWRFDITRSWSGSTKTEAELKQKSSPPIYEIELECLEPQLLMNEQKFDSYYVASSMLLKMRDFFYFMGTQPHTFKWEPLGIFCDNGVSCF